MAQTIDFALIPKNYAIDLTRTSQGWSAVLQRADIFGVRYGPEFDAGGLTENEAIRAAAAKVRR